MKKPVFRFLLVGALLAITGSLVYGLPRLIAALSDNNAFANYSVPLIFSQRFDVGLLIGLVAVSPALYLAGSRFRKKGKSLNLTWIVLPTGVLIFGWNMVVYLYRFIFAPYLPPEPIGWWVGVILNLVLPTAAFSYALIKRVKLEFKWSALSMVGMIVVVYFGALAAYQLFDPNISKLGLFVPGFDHTFYPIAFGLIALCDLKKCP